MPRPAYYEAAEEFPGLPVRLWCRLYRLMAHRGLLTSGPALRLAAYLVDTDTVRGDGTIPDVAAMLDGYAARARVSRQSGWTDLGRLVDAGLVRQVQAAAPGIRARYRLSAPAAAIAEHMPGLPPVLARALRPPAGPPVTTTEPVDEHQDTAVSDWSCGELDTSPLMHDGSPRPQPRSGNHGTNRRSGRPCGGESQAGKAAADALLAACRSEWARQRGAHRVPCPADVARLVPLTSRALEVIARPHDVRQLLTERVASADNLVRTLRWRLSREIADARRAETARVSPEEEAAAEQRAAEHYQAQREAGQAAVAEHRRPGYAERAAAVVDLARRIRAEAEPRYVEDRRLVEELAARAERARVDELDRWRAETAASDDGEQALAEIRRLLAGSVEDRSRARALAQLTVSRIRS